MTHTLFLNDREREPLPPEQLTAPATTKAVRSLLKKLYALRQSLTDAEAEVGSGGINALIKELRTLSRAAPAQWEKMVIYSIEVQGATTVIEISEDTRLHRSIVQQVVARLLETGRLYESRHFVIGMDRPRSRLNSSTQDRLCG